jgi:hypothetical protein
MSYIPIPSASRASLYMACPVSAVLPQARNIGESIGLGNAGHEHLQMRATHGVDAAMAALPDLCAKHELSENLAGILTAKLRGFEWSPPSSALTEVFLALGRDGKVSRHDAPKGRYPKLPDDTRITATIDVLWPEIDGHPVAFDWVVDAGGQPVRPRTPKGAILYVCDYKFGKLDGATEPVENNRQLEVCSLLAGRWTSASHVVPAIIYPGKGKGTWDTPPRPLAGQDAQEIEQRIDKMGRSIYAQRRRLEEGDPLTPTEGPHCTYCAAQWRCPAKTAMIKGVLSAPVLPGESPLTPGEATRAAEILPQIERFGKRLKDALKAHVEATGQPIPLSDGRVWGPAPHYEKVVNPDVAAQVIADEFGQEATAVAITRTVSREGIKDAARAHLEAQGKSRGVEPAVRRVYAKMNEAGGIVEQQTTWWTFHRPNGVEPPHEEAEIEDLG